MLKGLTKLGSSLRRCREQTGEGIKTVAKKIGEDHSYLSKIERGIRKPSKKLLLSLINHYSLPEVAAIRLWRLAGYSESRGLVVIKRRKGVIKVQEEKAMTGQDANQRKVQVNVPSNNPVLYSDSVFVTSNQFGIIFDFAQSVGPTDQQNVVARVGMSKEHARALVQAVEKRLKSGETKKTGKKN